MLVSAVAGRSIVAYIVALVALGAEAGLTGFASFPEYAAFGPLNPVAALYTEDCSLLGVPIPEWLVPLLFNGLLAVLAGTAAAEALPHYRPMRSALLRGLILAATFFVASLLATWDLENPMGLRTPIPAVVTVARPIVLFAWVYACALIPVFGSYVPTGPPRDVFGRWVYPFLSARRWFQRDARAGLGFSLLVFATAIIAALLPVGILLTFGAARVSGRATLWLAASLLLLGTSIAAYALWAAVLAAWVAARREVSLAVVLGMLALNAVGVIYGIGYGFVRHLPSHPALVLASPGAAALALMHADDPTKWSRYPAEVAVIVSLAYSMAVGGAAVWYFNRARSRAGVPQPSRPQARGLAPGDGESV